MRSHGAPSGDGWTKAELMEAGGLSAKTFDSVRKAARVRGPGHGGLDWVFSAADVLQLLACVEGGRFSERGGMAAAEWRRMLEEKGVEVVDAKKLRGRRGS